MPEGEKKSFREKMSDCGQFCYNSETGEMLGRTGKSWALVGVFYFFYYAALAGFFAACLAGFYSTLDSQSPTQKNMQSLLKMNPGMGFRPVLDVVSTLIKFDANKSETYKEYVQNLEYFLKVYEKPVDGAVECPPGIVKADDSTVCTFPLTNLGPKCTRENSYGYAEGRPCVLLKINKIYGWVPVPFENGTDEIPEAVGDRFDPGYVGVSCSGESESDVNNIKDITFYPDKGFPVVYYPYLNQQGYQTPVVMAQFDLIPGRLVMVWCKVWARNIKHHRVDLQGSAHFELVVDYRV